MYISFMVTIDAMTITNADMYISVYHLTKYIIHVITDIKKVITANTPGLFLVFMIVYFTLKHKKVKSVVKPYNTWS